MCDAQTKLIAWLDKELAPEEAVLVERHVEACQECRTRMGAYRQVSESFDVYCDRVLAAKTRRVFPYWVPVLAAAMVATAVFLSTLPRARVQPPPMAAPVTAEAVPVPAPPV